jgi:hypothetical protein
MPRLINFKTTQPTGERMSNIRLKAGNELFWAFQYPDLPKNQAEVNNPLVGDHGFDFGDRVEFDEDRRVTRLIKTSQEVQEELQNNK